MLMKPPMKGAIRGPKKTVLEKQAIAIPRVRLLKISEKTAATTANGELPKIPQKKRQIIRVCRSLETATAVLKMPNPSMAKTIPGRRPLSSDNGAQMRGPDA